MNVRIEDLIVEVKKKPLLWDPTIKEYKKKNFRKDAWQEVCNALIDDFSERNSEERENIGQAVMKRWNNVRDAFRRSLRIETRKRSEDGASKLKKYVYFEQLRFLKTIFDERPTEDTLSAPDENVTSDIEGEGEGEGEVYPDDPAPHESLTSDTSSSRKTSISKRKRGKNDELEEQMLKVLHRKEHPLLSFWKGLMPGIADFSSDEILELQSEIIFAIRNIRKRRQNPVLSSSTRSIPIPQDIMHPHNRPYIPEQHAQHFFDSSSYPYSIPRPETAPPSLSLQNTHFQTIPNASSQQYGYQVTRPRTSSSSRPSSTQSSSSPSLHRSLADSRSSDLNYE